MRPAFTLCLRSVACALFLPLLAPAAENLYPGASCDDCTEGYNPWAGVDSDKNIHGIDGKQYAVGDDGGLYLAAFGPSVAAGDLNGDGKIDLVLADTRGYIWFYPNSGTATKPQFTQGQVIPVWLGEKKINEVGAGTDNIVPRLQLIDYNNSGKLSLVIGTSSGRLFYVPNTGTASQPNFPVVKDITQFNVPTRSRGMLWCNYLAPFLVPWYGPNILDLVMGEGTYSANSIYLLKNLNASAQPVFNETQIKKIIPGMGLEQLTPAVVDWNNDGKPDIIAGDRGGYLTLFLNTSTDPKNPTFAPGTHVTVGGSEKLGAFTTVAIADLTNNHLPNLLIGTDAGTVLYAINKGTLGKPDFNGDASPLQGINPYPPIMVPTNWIRAFPPGIPDELVTCTNPTIEPALKTLPVPTAKYAVKFSLFPITDPTFPKRYYPEQEDFLHEHSVACNNSSRPLKTKGRFVLHLFTRSSGNVGHLYAMLDMTYYTAKGRRWLRKKIDLDVSGEWTENNRPFDTDVPEDTDDANPISVQIRFQGQGTLYMSDFTVTEK